MNLNIDRVQLKHIGNIERQDVEYRKGLDKGKINRIKNLENL